MAEPLLEIAANFRIGFQELVCEKQQVNKIELAGARFEIGITIHQVLHLAAQLGCEVGAGLLAKFVQRLQQPLAAVQDIFSPDTFAKHPRALTSVLLNVALEL